MNIILQSFHWHAVRLRILNCALFLMCILALGGFVACEAGKKPEARKEEAKTYQFKGKVVSIETNKASVTINHEEIPGYMPAMTMPFPVKNPTILNDLEEGDEVLGILKVTSEEGWLDEVSVMTDPEEEGEAHEGRVEVIKLVTPVGEAVPDIELTDHNGKPSSLHQLKGKTVVLNFIFTRCPFPNFCPFLSKSFAAAQKELAQSPATNGPVHFLSISMDPEHDTPEVLREYAERYGADLRTWTFATTPTEELKKFGTKLGLVFWNQDGTINHNLSTAVIGPDGTLVRLFKGNQWTVQDLLAVIRKDSSPSAPSL